MSTAKIKDLEQCCEVFKEWIQIEEKMIAIILKKQKELSDDVAQWNDYLIDQQQSSKHRQQMLSSTSGTSRSIGTGNKPNPFGAGGKFDMGDVRGSAIAQRRRGGTRKKSHRRKKNIRKTRRRRNNK